MQQDIKIDNVLIKDLKPADYNPRKMDTSERAKVKESLQLFGCVDPIIANKSQDRFNIIIGGHLRVECAKELGWSEVPVVYIDIPDINKEKELNLRLNKNSGEWDLELLAKFDLGLLQNIGFSSQELDKIFKPVDSEKDDQVPDEAPAIAQVGDIWALGRHRIMCGDSTKRDDVERLMGGGEGGYGVYRPSLWS